MYIKKQIQREERLDKLEQKLTRNGIEVFETFLA